MRSSCIDEALCGELTLRSLKICPHGLKKLYWLASHDTASRHRLVPQGLSADHARRTGIPPVRRTGSSLVGRPGTEEAILSPSREHFRPRVRARSPGRDRTDVDRSSRLLQSLERSSNSKRMSPDSSPVASKGSGAPRGHPDLPAPRMLPK